jgi:5-oxoprolinase (ATP-hydrolysing)
MNGGMPGKTGEQFLIRNNKTTKLNGTDGVSVLAGDVIVIKTPGGGGWGKMSI